MISLTKWPLTDPQALAELLELHVSASPAILDATYGKGIVWAHLPVRQQVIKVDINPALPNLDLVADWRELPLHYPPGSIDCLVWDPIHVADVGKKSRFYGRYVAPQNAVKGDSVSHLYEGFLEVATRLVKPKTGICLVKLCDQVHSARQQWQVLDLVTAAQGRGWTACGPEHDRRQERPQAQEQVPRPQPVGILDRVTQRTRLPRSRSTPQV